MKCKRCGNEKKLRAYRKGSKSARHGKARHGKAKESLSAVIKIGWECKNCKGKKSQVKP